MKVQNMETMEEIPVIKNVKLSKEEQAFLKEYRRLEELEREKGIKFFSCIGDPQITQETIENIKQSRAQIIEDKEENIREKDVTRYNPEID